MARIFGRPFFCQKNVRLKTSEHSFWKKSCLSPCPKGIRPLIKLLIKEQFFHKFPRHWAMRGPSSLLQVFLRVHNCSKPVQSRSWSQEKKGRPFPKASFSFSSLFLSLFLLFLFLFLSLSLSVPLNLPLPLLFPLRLSLSLSLSLSLVPLLFFFLFLLLLFR